ncbi:MAG TPA: IPExxxVDY family protein [Bacteroidales bacterium]|nr:IPExxxVDY family protein [Bacteroidales bacterium]
MLTVLKKKVHKLIFEPETGFKLIGISSHENDYRLSWALNKYLGYNFSKSENLLIQKPKHNIEQSFSVYIYNDEETFLQYQLIANNSENGFLIPELKNIDFFLKISGEYSDSIINKIVTKLKKIEIINTAFNLENLSERNKKVFTF